MKTLVVGAAMIDMVMVMDRLPRSGEDVMCSEASLEVGGCAYNVASTLRNLKCAHDLCVPVGNGPYGAIIQSALEKNGYKILIRDRKRDNGYCIGMVESSGERTFVNYQGTEGDFQREWFEGLPMEQYENIYIAGYQVCGNSGKVISEWLEKLQNKKVYFAPGPVICKISSDVMTKIMKKHPVLHLNEKEAFDYTGQNSIEHCVESLYQQNHNLAVVTVGGEGAVYYDGKEMHRVSSRTARVIDTIGAGDSHAGALIAGISMGMSTEESVKLANTVASNMVEVYGPVMDEKTFNERIGNKAERIL